MNTSPRYTTLRSLGLVLVLAALVFGGLGLTGAAAQAAIPGDALYPVKSTIEQARLSLAADAGDRAELRLGFAEQRLSELEGLISQERYDEVSPAVLAFETDLHGALLELETVWRLDPARGRQITLDITSALARFAQSLSAIAANAPEGVQSDVARALDTTGFAGDLDLEPDDLLEGDEGDDDGRVEAHESDSDVREDEDCSSADDDSLSHGGDDDCTSVGEDGSTNGSDDDQSDDDGEDSPDDPDQAAGSDDDSSNGADDSGGDDD